MIWFSDVKSLHIWEKDFQIGHFGPYFEHIRNRTAIQKKEEFHHIFWKIEKKIQSRFVSKIFLYISFLFRQNALLKCKKKKKIAFQRGKNIFNPLTGLQKDKIFFTACFKLVWCGYRKIFFYKMEL